MLFGIVLVPAVLTLLVSDAQATPGLKTLRARGKSNTTIAYKETHLCETNYGVRSYSGYITLLGRNNIFFWFFEARTRPSSAPLTVWLQGGPGMASTTQAVSGHNGPCIVGSDSSSTVNNPWSWNRVSNMLYIDQPVGTGFSYDTATPGVMDIVTGDIDVSGSGSVDSKHIPGVFASQDPVKVYNTTEYVAEAIVQFLELWFNDGGHYAPAIARLLTERTSSKCRSSSSKPKKKASSQSFNMKVDSVGVINGVIDLDIQLPYYPKFAVNNTYGIRAYNETVATGITAKLEAQGGCRDQGIWCRQLQQKYDPDNLGSNRSVNQACVRALFSCQTEVVLDPYQSSGQNNFDIGHLMPDSFPPPYGKGFLQQEWVRDALGASVNFTDTSSVAQQSFIFSDDYVRGYLPDIGALLDAGVKVALINGDRDYQCNWFGGEAVSLAINYTGQAAFASAGYADLVVNDSYIGGKVRQHGLLSFTRVFEAGHEVPYYQPETAYMIFSRTLGGHDVAMGSTQVTPQYSTTGPSAIFDVTNVAPPQPHVECYVEAAPINTRCTPNQIAALQNGTAVVHCGIMVSPVK